MRERFHSQLLAGERPATPLGAAERLLAIQAQDLRAFRLAVRVRCRAPTVAALDSALAERELVVSWLNRGTLHLVPSEDYHWLHPLMAQQIARPLARRREQLGIAPAVAERAVSTITTALADGPLTRPRLVDLLAKRGLPSEGQGPVQLLALAAQRGLIVRGPMHGRQQAYVLRHDWLGPAAGAASRERALAELARRYLAGHGPAGARDLSRWSGLPLTECRTGLDAISTQLVERSDGLVALEGREAPDQNPPPLLLGAFEPLLLGWDRRDDVAGENWPKLARGGMISPFALVEGQAAATWRIERRHLELAPFQPLDRAVRALLDGEAEAVMRYLDAKPIQP